MAKTGNITLARLKQVLHYNPKTGDWTWLVMLRSNKPVGSRAGTLRPDKYRSIQIDGVVYRASRLAWLYMTGELPEFEVDHKDTDPSNDRWRNLREATSTQNKGNRSKYKNNKCGLKGVSFRGDKLKRLKPWRAVIQVRGRYMHLGDTETSEEAHALYVAAAKKHFGKFARHQ